MTRNTLESPAMSREKIYRSASQLFFFCFLAYACSYIGRKNFSACLPAMIEEAFITKSYAGYVTTAYMFFYGAGQLINGFVSARIKPQYMVGVGLCGATVCNFAMGLVPSPLLMPVIWGANGLFHSMLWAPIIRVFTDRLPAGRREKAGTNISVSCSLGAVLAFLLPAFVLRFAHWRVVFYVSGSVLLLALTVWVVGHGFLRKYIRMMDEACVRERAALRERAEAEAARENRATRKYSLFPVIFGTGLWIMLFCIFCNGALRDAVETWAPTFLSEQFGMDGSMAALTSVIIPLVSVTGTYAADWLNRRFIRNEVYTSCIMYGVGALCVGGLFLCRHTNPFICAVFMAIAVASMWGVNHMFLTVVPYRFSSLGLSSTISGFFNGAIYIATAACSAVYGILAETRGWNFLILVWLGVGLAGILFGLLSGGLWRKKRALLDEGKI